MNRDRAFTLIELLMVVAILAVLAALLFPVFSNAREAARRTACSSHLKQIGTAYLLYADAWDGVFPQTWLPSNTPTLDWMTEKLEPFTHKKGKGVWICPSDQYRAFLEEYLEKENASYSSTGTMGTYMSYWPSRQFFNANWGSCYQKGDAGRPAATVERPSLTIMTGDGVFAWILPKSPGDLTDLLHVKQSGTWHGWRSNYLFADGHVKSLNVRQTLQPVVLWDNLPDWCPECSCAETEGWKSDHVSDTLKALDRVGYPR